METLFPPMTPVVIDVSLAVHAVLPLGDEDILRQITIWQKESRPLHDPALWAVECVSVIRQYHFSKVINSREARHAIDDLFMLGVKQSPMDHGLCLCALE